MYVGISEHGVHDVTALAALTFFESHRDVSTATQPWYLINMCSQVLYLSVLVEHLGHDRQASRTWYSRQAEQKRQF